ncbi:hypothetical protein KOW79_013280 [Hemibagrus wyckioides]|uniref:Uncharacterized protein n=1 Tax=Hemibagrus wyckioides TaxID=337641 RepID=A0A9D3NLS3_9TELE|nr:hypothetical protein KOW79_013280 [Hemibagrus wyckioides]
MDRKWYASYSKAYRNPAATTPLSQIKSGKQEADRKSSLQKEQLLRRVGQMKGDEQYRSGSRGRMAGGAHEAELLENKNKPGGHQDLRGWEGVVLKQEMG